MSSVTSRKSYIPRLLDTVLLRMNTVHRAWWYYLVVVLSVGIALGIERLFPLVFQYHKYVLFWGVIVFNAWYGGVLPGIAAAIISMLVSDFFIERPYHHLDIELIDTFRVLTGVGISVLINVPNARARRIQAQMIAHYQALQQSEARFRRVLENMPILLSVKDENGRQVFWNKEAERVTGYTANEVISNPDLGDFFYPDREYRAEINRFRREQAGDWRNWELATRCKDGQIRIISWSNISRHFPIPGWHDWAMGIDITDQKHAQAERETLLDALQTERARLETILRQMPSGVLIAEVPSGDLLLVNERAKQITGFSFDIPLDLTRHNQPGSMVGQTADERVYQAEDWPLARVVRDGEVIENEEIEFLRADGHRIFIRANGAPIYDDDGRRSAGIVIFQDITEIKRAQQRTETLQAITSALSAAVTPLQVSRMILDRCIPAVGAAAGVIVQLSEAETDLEIILSSNYSPGLTTPYQNFPVSAAIPLAESVRERKPIWLRSSADRGDLYPQLADLDTPYRAWASLPLLVENRVLGALGFSFAREQIYSADDQAFMMALANQCAQAIERARLFEAESAAREQAEQANALKLQFLGMVSHELRTPLSSIKGFASTLLAEDVEFDVSSQREFLTVIDQEADRLSDLVEQLLDLARLQASSMSIHQEAQTFAAILESAAAGLKTLTAHHEWVVDVPANLPPVFADTRRVDQIILNLVGNAARYTPPFTTITLRARPVNGMLQVDVIDQGPGIPQGERTRVFEAFRQGNAELDKRSQGTGLGLAICKGLVEAHGGTIWIQDTPPPGTTISFTLPLATSM